MKLLRSYSRIYPHIIACFLLFVVIILTFRQLPQTFYQQDEWLGSGQVKALGWEVVTLDNSILQILFADGRPLSRILGVFFLEYFPFDPVPLAIYSIIFHFINSVLVYLIIYKLIKQKLFSLIGSLYFAVASVSHQTVTWFAAAFGAQASSVLIFLSILLFLTFIENSKKRYLYASFVSVIISLYFKETGVFLFPLFFIIPFIFNRKYPIKKLLTSYIPLFIFSAIFTLYRVLEMVLIRTPSQGSVYLTSNTQNIFGTLLVRSFFYPLTSLSLSFLTQPTSTFLAEGLWKIYYPFIKQRPDLVFQTVVLDLIAMILSALLLVLLYVISRKKQYTKVVVFSLVFFLFSILPYIVISKDYAYLEPRYYYIPLLSSALVISIIFSFLNNILKGFKKVLLVVLILLYIVYLRFNISVVRHDIAYQVTIAQERKSFINQLYSYLPPSLESSTNIFYFTGSKSWLVEGNKTPFQNGFGYTLMVLYYDSGKIPKYLPTSEYLWKLGEQGMKDLDGLRYGYYNDFNTLKESVQKNSISINDVHSFYYDWDKKKLLNITEKIREDLKKQTNSLP